MKFVKIISSIVLSCLLCLCSTTAFAQEVTGSIVGTVRDSNGAAVPGATVTITDPSKDNLVVRTATTSDDGAFSAPNLTVSVYSVTIEAANFKKSVQTDVKLDVGQRRNVEFALEAGNVSEVVTVEADAVGVELSTPTASTTINGDQVRELSINNRNFVQLVALAPGVSSNLSDQVFVGTTNPDGQANTINLAVNGARSSQNTFTVDGADITDRGSNITIQAYPSVDSIGEFKILRSLYPAESGRSGGGQVNVVTRSGTDEFHGSLFEFVRNEGVNANSYFNNQRAPLGLDEELKANRPPFRYNNYGGTIGGPVYFFNFGEGEPGNIFRKLDRTFFFFSEEQRKDIRYPSFDTLASSPTTLGVPSTAVRNGVFPIDICLAGTITAGVQNCPAASVLTAGTPLSSRVAVNPIAQAYINNIYSRLPEPNAPNFRLLSASRNTFDFRQEIVKIDHQFNDKLSAFYRFQNDKIPTLEANSLFSSGTGLPGVATTSTDSPGRTHTVQATYALSSRVIVEGRYARSYGAILSQNVGFLATSNSNIPVPLPYTVTRDRVPSISGNGFNALAGFGPYDNFSNKNDFSGNLTVIFGNHTTKYGGVFSKYRKNENALAGSNEGAFSGFNNTTAASPTQGIVRAPNVGNIGLNNNLQSFANFLIGSNVTFTQARFDYTADLRQRNFEAYAQDEYRVRPNLTLYLGARYSFFGSPYDENGRLSNFDPNLYNRANAPQVTGAGNRVVGSGNFCEGIIVNSQNVISIPNCTPTVSPYGKFVVNAQKTNFAPRVGFAFDPFSKGTTSIRAGYGIYHEQTLNGLFLQNIGTNSPYQQTCTLAGVSFSNPDPNNTCNSTAFGFGVAQSVRAVDTDFKTPYMQHWSLDVQQQLTRKTVVSVGYYGSRGVNLIGVTDINLLPPGRALTQQCATGANTLVTPNATLVQCQAQGVPFISAAQTLLLDQIRPYRGYRAINIIKPIFNSDYHSLQVSAQHRFSGASQVNLAYTFSKNLTDAQTDRSSSPQNPYDIRSEYGRAALDRRHILTVNYVYELPFYRSQQGFVGKLLGGFQTSSIITYNTGLPFTATTANYDPAGIGFLGASASGPRPNQIGNPNADAPNTQQNFFNPTAFQTVFPQTGVANTPGSAGRGTIFGPSLTRVDLTLTKNIRFTEDISVQLRAESFNLFNTTNFNTFGANATTFNANPLLNSFGSITGTRDPRNFQFGAKLYF